MAKCAKLSHLSPVPGQPHDARSVQVPEEVWWKNS